VAATGDRVFGSRALNEIRMQIAHRTTDVDVDGYCAGCITENRPGILLGKSDVAPEQGTERRWQFADTVTVAVPDRLGDHAFKTGAELSVLAIGGYQPANFDGTFTFRVNTPFDAADPGTYPTLYRRNSGEASYDLSSRVYAVFIQDEWRPTSRMTMNLGVRWDYEDTIGVASDADNVAPRLAVAFTPGDTSTAIRGAYGVYYDAVLFQALVNTIRGSQVARLQVTNPGYPDPFGPNPNRPGSAVNAAPSGRRFADSIRTPFTEQTSVGVSHQRSTLSITADVVWARGRNLLRTRDGNYPNLDDPRLARPDPAFQEILIRETEGRSSYRALEIGMQKRPSRRHSYSVAYTLSRAERDTEDWDFLPQDQRNYGAEWGPASNDVRHRLVAGGHIELPHGVRLATILTATSALPYNVTTGTDDNRDTYMTDRPPGVSRNSARSSASRQIDARLSKAIRAGAYQIEFVAEVFNVANQRNWIAYDGVTKNSTFGKPTDAAAAREVQIGIRVGF
jgi:hypothetical protein